MAATMLPLQWYVNILRILIKQKTALLSTFRMLVREAPFFYIYSLVSFGRIRQG